MFFLSAVPIMFFFSINNKHTLGTPFDWQYHLSKEHLLFGGFENRTYWRPFHCRSRICSSRVTQTHRSKSSEQKGAYSCKWITVSLCGERHYILLTIQLPSLGFEASKSTMWLQHQVGNILSTSEPTFLIPVSRVENFLEMLSFSRLTFFERFLSGKSAAASCKLLIEYFYLSSDGHDWIFRLLLFQKLMRQLTLSRAYKEQLISRMNGSLLLWISVTGEMAKAGGSHWPWELALGPSPNFPSCYLTITSVPNARRNLTWYNP